MEDIQGWLQLLVGIVLGGVVTGLFQYLLLERKHRNEQENINLSAKLSAKKEYLSKELEHRNELYRKTNYKVYDALQNPTDENLDEAIRSLATDIPFFQPTYESQQGYLTQKDRFIILLKKRKEEPHNEDISSRCDSSWNDLKSSMARDVKRIENELSYLRTLDPR